MSVASALRMRSGIDSDCRTPPDESGCPQTPARGAAVRTFGSGAGAVALVTNEGCSDVGGGAWSRTCRGWMWNGIEYKEDSCADLVS